MKLGEFIRNFSHNNIVRLLYKMEDGCNYEIVSNSWSDVSMDWEINYGIGIFRHYINNEVIGVLGIYFSNCEMVENTDAINIIIERLENQPFIEEVLEDKINEENVID